MPYLNAPGVRLHVQELGAGPPVVMLHGLLLGSLAAWYFTAAPVLARESRVVLYDLRGHGRSERVGGGYDSDTQVGDLEAVTAELDTPLTLVGHSFGALVALKFALRHPRRVARLALVELPLPPGSAGDIDGFLARSPEEALDALPEAVLKSAQGGGRAARRLLEHLDFLASRSTLLADLAAEPDIPDAVLAGLHCPVLLAYGKDSACRPVGERLAGVLPDARLAVLEGGHYLHLDATEALTDLLRDFCRA
ncbi:alpha/beta fold hydrolase [Elongatibacter sediminis]|uniref:Alpha/beta fold hydrolase n=1 Tax=Elongatibacter sediminis TaxID=3119006 RepID=A0AAW9REW0_9GAMM